MGGVELLRSKAEECLEKARVIGDRQRARFLLVQAHNYLKYAEETDAQQWAAAHGDYREGYAASPRFGAACSQIAPYGRDSRPSALRGLARGPAPEVASDRAQYGRVLWAAAIGYTPHRAVCVLADEERAVMGHRYADRARPHRGVVDDKPGHEVLIFAGRHSVLQPHADHFIAGALRAVPRAVLGRKHIPAVFRGELVAIVDDHHHRGRMRLDQHVGDGDLVP